ncbi:MAG: hypothetical protein AAFX65_07275 [Cyanobacteria bacterium J06638_7]
MAIPIGELRQTAVRKYVRFCHRHWAVVVALSSCPVAASVVAAALLIASGKPM